MFGVSQLCCPVCSELLEVLSKGSENFEVRGHHATVTPVQLPRWLPRDVLEQMVVRFKNHLLREIFAMTQSIDQ